MSRVISTLFIFGFCCLVCSASIHAQSSEYVDKAMTDKVASLIQGDVSRVKVAGCIAASSVGVKRALEVDNGEGAARGYKFAEQTWSTVYGLKGGSQDSFQSDYERGDFSKVASSDERGVINGHIVNCMNGLMSYLSVAKKEES